MIEVERYDSRQASVWDDFVDQARNGSFLFKRGYMDYHADRFEDFSLMARGHGGKLIAVLPACRRGAELSTHAGLTFGGWIVADRRCDALDMLEIWEAMTALLLSEGFSRIVYKAMPYIYHRRPAQEDRYAIFRAGGQLSRSLVSSVVDLDDPIPFDQGSRQRARKAAALPGISIGPSEDFRGFWQVLSRLLDTRYGAEPVHSLEEIELLHGRFPDNIRLYTAVLDGELLAGVVIYVSPTAVHSQYTAASPAGKELSVVPAIYSRILDDYKGRVRWFDFGTSNEDDGRAINPGLLRQKCSYGARAVVYDTFTIEI